MTTMTIAVPEEFVDFLYVQRLAPVQMLTGFAHDLSETQASHGSDERQLANEWFARMMWPELDDEMDEAFARAALKTLSRDKISMLSGWHRNFSVQRIRDSLMAGVGLARDNQLVGNAPYLPPECRSSSGSGHGQGWPCCRQLGAKSLMHGA